MQSLAKRHEDRARRLSMNAAERGNFGDPAQSVGTVALAYRQYAMLRVRLTNETAISELDKAIEGIDAEFAGGYRSLAEHPDGSGRTMAGIGVVTPAVVPAAVLAVSDEGKGASAGNDPAWGDIKPVTLGGEADVSFDPSAGNLNGQALSEQVGDVANSGGGWGTAPSTGPAKANPLAGNGGGTSDTNSNGNSGDSGSEQ